MQISKIDVEQRRVFGWGYVAKTADGEQVVDHSGDFIDAVAWPHFEDAAYRYVRDARDMDDMHSIEKVATLIEQVVMTPEKALAMGLDPSVPSGTWQGWEFPKTAEGDAAWEQVKKGARGSLSIVGSGTREEVDDA